MIHRAAWLLLGVTLCMCGCGKDPSGAAGQDLKPAASANYVGRGTCVDCHEVEVGKWMNSHHDLAMDVASEETVLGDFDDATFEFRGVRSTFSRRNGSFIVRSDGPDGELRDYEVAYVFGVTPLQQYLITFPGGRYQVLPLCWDTRPKEEGGQRWFHLYPDEGIDHTDSLHWTRIAQNWNHVCAECHSTDLRKQYDLETDSFDTTWEEIDVSCEACHGPASRHVEWALAEERGEEPQKVANSGLTLGLEDVGTGLWIPDYEMGTAQRSVPRRSQTLIETCARCHSRRSQIAGEYAHDRPLLDTHLLTLLDEPLYHADGQIRGEVYVYGSFVQSKMFHAGVTCNDCHDSHSLQLYEPGDAVCSRCHQASKFEAPAHHFHEAGTAGASCLDCHMPETTYMVVDPRRDHSMRIPRPDLSVSLGTPNACNQCHEDQTSQWAADAVAEWYGPERRAEPHFGEALQAGRRGVPGAEAALIALARDASQPAIARATALSLLASYPSPEAFAAIQAALAVDDPLMRGAAARALEMAPPADRLRLGAPLLTDPVRAVRYEAASTLAAVPPTELNPQQLAAVERAAAEYIESQLASADRPEAHMNVGVIQSQRGRFADAEASYRTAIRLDPTFTAAYVNLSDLYRATGRDVEGERLLRDALAIVQQPAGVHHALGLALVRLGRTDEALEALDHAVRLEPEAARLRYVYAVALDSVGARPQAILQLEMTLEHHPHDRDVLTALVTMNREAGNRARAARHARRLLELYPEDASLRQLITELER